MHSAAAMPKRYKENIAYADRQRKAQREKKMAIPVDQPITFSGLGEYIRESEQYRHRQKTLTGGISSGMGIGGGILGGIQRIDYCIPSPPSPYISPASQEESTEGDHYIIVPSAEINALNAELADAKIQIAERDEMIEALAHDMALISDLEDAVELLREENARLNPLPSLSQDGLAAQDWVPWDGGACPVPPETIVDVAISGWSDDHSHGRKANTWGWGRGGGTEPITAYRIVG